MGTLATRIPNVYEASARPTKLGPEKCRGSFVLRECFIPYGGAGARFKGLQSEAKTTTITGG